MLRNIVIFVAALLVALVGYLAKPMVANNAVLAVGVACLEGGVVALALGIIWWGIDRMGAIAFVKLVIEIVLIAIVAFTSLALGGTPAWTWVIVEMLAALAVILWGVRMLLQKRISYVRTPLNILLILLVFYVFLQLVPVPAPLLKVFQSNTLRVQTVGPANVKAAALQPLDVGGTRPISLNREQTRSHLFLLMAYVAFFLVLVNNTTSRAQIGRLLATIIAAAAITAVAGFATEYQNDRLLYRYWSMGGPGETPNFLNADANPEFSAGYGFVFPMQESDKMVDFYVPKTHGGNAFAGFPRSDSAATLLVMVLVVALGSFFAYISTYRSQWGQSGGLLYTREGNLALLLLFLAVVIAAGLFMSGSRAGLAVALLMVPVLIVLVGFFRSKLAGFITLAVVVLVLVLPFIVLGTGGVRHALSQDTATWLDPFDEEFRFMGRQASWDIIGDFPMFGTGYGTYASVYPGYKVRGPMLYFAHCDVLQWMSETGLVGLLLGGAILVTLFWTAVTGWFRLKDSFSQRLLLGCTLACAAFLLHGLVDFPLAIPGVVIVFVALAALAIILAKDRIAREEESDFIF